MTVEVVDQAGELVPDAVVPVSLSVSGAAELAAAGSANPKDVESFRRDAPEDVPRPVPGDCETHRRRRRRHGAGAGRGLPAASIVVQVS